MDTVCLHIGLPKTGSSAIQAFLEAKVDELGELGVHYARNHHTHSARGIVSNGNGRPLVKYLDPRRRPQRFDERQYERVLQKIYFSRRHPTAVISSELLASIHWPQLAPFTQRVLEGRRVIVVAVIRNLYDHALSSWNQAVKWHAYTDTFEAYAQNVYHNHQVRSVCRYADHFGWDSLRLIRYEARRDDLILAFLEAIGAAAPSGWKAPVTNRSLTHAELAIQLALNRLHEDADLAKRAAERFIASRPRAAAAALWRPDIAQLLTDRFASEVEALSATTGQDLQDLLTPRPRRCRAASALEYARAACDALPVAGKVLKARFTAAAEATASAA